MKQKLNFITGLGVAALLAGSLANAQQMITEGPFEADFPEGKLDIDESRPLPAACQGANDRLVSVLADYSMSSRVSLETTNNTSDDTRSYNVTVTENPLALTVGNTNLVPGASGASVNRTGSLDAGESAMDVINPLTDLSGNDVSIGVVSAFEAGTATVTFEAVGDSIVRNASNVDSVISHFAQANVEVTYTCERQVCPFDPTLPPDDPACPRCPLDSNLSILDPLCEACPFNPNILASDDDCFERCPVPGKQDLPADSDQCFVPCEFDPSIPNTDPACVPPPPVPGITTYGLIGSILGLPLIAGFFAVRRRMKK